MITKTEADEAIRILKYECGNENATMLLAANVQRPLFKLILQMVLS